MFDKIPDTKKKEFIRNSFIYYPISFILALLLLLGMSKLFKIELTVGSVIFVVGALFLTSVALILRYYKKMCQS